MKISAHHNSKGWQRFHLAYCAAVAALVLYAYVMVSVAVSSSRQSSSRAEVSGTTPRRLAKDQPSTGIQFEHSNFQTQEDIHRYYDQRLRLLTEVIGMWPPEQAGVTPSDWVDLVPRFDWLNDTSREIALRFRQAERPFIMRNVPSVLEANEKWTDEYLALKFGKKKGRVEKSETNSFMFWRGNKKKDNLRGLTEWLQMPWSVFRELAARIDITNKPKEPHYYWHAQEEKDDNWIKSDLTLFDKENNFFIVDKSEYNTPVSCRVGTKGLCNENHYDTHRTFAAQVVGSKRWIFMPPSMCSKLYLYPPGHMSARHSAVDINSGRIDESTFPLAADAVAIDTVVHAGEVAYLPSNWFHHIISQEFNIQCIARSGHSMLGNEDIQACGFKV